MPQGPLHLYPRYQAMNGAEYVQVAKLGALECEERDRLVTAKTNSANAELDRCDRRFERPVHPAWRAGLHPIRQRPRVYRNC